MFNSRGVDVMKVWGHSVLVAYLGIMNGDRRVPRRQDHGRNSMRANYHGGLHYVGLNSPALKDFEHLTVG